MAFDLTLPEAQEENLHLQLLWCASSPPDSAPATCPLLPPTAPTHLLPPHPFPAARRRLFDTFAATLTGPPARMVSSSRLACRPHVKHEDAPTDPDAGSSSSATSAIASTTATSTTATSTTSTTSSGPYYPPNAATRLKEQLGRVVGFGEANQSECHRPLPCRWLPLLSAAFLPAHPPSAHPPSAHPLLLPSLHPFRGTSQWWRSSFSAR